MVAVNIIGSLVGAGATMAAASSAASATQNATNASIAEQNQALAQQAQLSAPYRALGQSAIPQLQSLLGLTPSGAPAAPGAQQAALAATPGYQFALQQGLQSTQASANAMGLGLSGNTLTALDQYSTGLANQTYQQAVGNVENVVGLGQAAAAGQAANIGNAAANISGSLTNQGINAANIDINQAAALSKIAGGVAGQYATYNTLQGLQNPGGVSPINYAPNPYATDVPTGVVGPIS
jgi:hypothetical protein